MNITVLKHGQPIPWEQVPWNVQQRIEEDDHSIGRYDVWMWIKPLPIMETYRNWAVAPKQHRHPCEQLVTA